MLCSLSNISYNIKNRSFQSIPPRDLKATVAIDQVTLTWTAARMRGTGLRYNIQTIPATSVLTTTNTTITFSLNLNTLYTIQLQATNDSGTLSDIAETTARTANIQTGPIGLPVTSSTIGYNSICCSLNGQYVYVACDDGIRISSDCGTTFTLLNSYPDVDYPLLRIADIDCNDSGSVVWCTTSKCFYRCTDYGNTITRVTNIGSNQFIQGTISCDGTGDFVTYVTYGGAIMAYHYPSNTYKAMYTDSTIGWLGCTVSKDGKLILASGNSKGGNGYAGVVYIKNVTYTSTGIQTPSVTNDVKVIYYKKPTTTDENIVSTGQFASRDSGSRMYLTSQDGAKGAWTFTNTTTALTIAGRIATGIIDQTIQWSAITALPNKNFVAIATSDLSDKTKMSIVYSTNNMSGGTKLTGATFPLVNSAGVATANGARISMCSFEVGTKIALLITTNANSTGLKSHMILI